jgi:tripartite-type tricarboxylate transporter receptor subunit TctC
VLGVTSLTRTPDLPDVPTMVEAGIPDYEVISWQGLCTPAGVPKAALTAFRAGLSAALVSPDTRKRLRDQGFDVTPLTSEKFAEFIHRERAKWTKLVRDLGIPQN